MVMVLVRNPIVLIFINFARVSSHFDDFNTCNKVMTAKRLKKGFGSHKLRKPFSSFIGGIIT